MLPLGSTTPQVVSDAQSLIDAVVAAMPFSTMILIIAAVITAGLTFVLGWFGVRYAVPRIVSAIKTGKLRV